ncbi:MAG TPA: hypothetical protein DCR63_08240 [Microbacterium sp.]|nr:hypothetical protein [Microbacterium sp.]
MLSFTIALRFGMPVVSVSIHVNVFAGTLHRGIYSPTLRPRGAPFPTRSDPTGSRRPRGAPRPVRPLADPRQNG